MLRCASSLVIAAYIGVRLIPQALGAHIRKMSPCQCAPQGKHIARLASGAFYKAVHFSSKSLDFKFV